MAKAAHPALKREEPDIEAHLSNEFTAGVIRGIREFKAGKGKTFDDKEEFLNSLREL
jgi:hypothetical protein